MTTTTENREPRNRADATLVGPSPFVRWVMGPMTKVFNPLVRRIAGRRHLNLAAKIHHVGRHSGARYVTPVSARLDKTHIIVPLTFGNRSDWCRNVLAAGGCTVQLGGHSYEAADPMLYWRDELREQLQGPFNLVERLAFRLLGIRRFLVLATVHDVAAVGRGRRRGRPLGPSGPD